MVILRKNGINGKSLYLILWASAYATARTHTVLPTQKTKTVDRDMKILRIVNIPNIPGNNDRFILKPESSPLIYLTVVMEVECCNVASNKRNQEEA